MSFIRLNAILFALCVALPGAAAAAAEAAKLYSAHGSVEARTSGAAEWRVLAVGDPLFDRDAVRTGPGSRAALVLSDGLMVRLNERSLFQLSLDGTGRPSELQLDDGDAHFFSRKEREFPTIRTQYVSASIRGTELSVSARSDRSEIAVLSGLVRAENGVGGVDLGAGEIARVTSGRAPEKSILIDPVGSVQWALYYPVTVAAEDFPEFPRETALVEGGEGDRALKLLAGAPPSASRDLMRAALLLAGGQVGAAESLHATVEQTLARLDPSAAATPRGILAAQRAIIAITRNQTTAGLERARAAALAAPRSVSAAVALSYVLQATGDLEGAWTTLGEGLVHTPGSSALMLRRAELALSRGESAAALRDATTVAAALPRSAYALTVRGFAELARLDIDGARTSFAQAIEFSAGDGLPFLGLGLTEIRRGDLAGGRISLQKAAHLEPMRSLYRSYLGKAFFEDEIESLAAEEFDRAIALDPNDPTPYLYRTFLNLSRNEPVKALDDIEASIALNDNRAVYRSRLLLDQDASVRSSSLANVYKSLGFTEIARIEAIRSLSKDYANYSAHLDLSQSYEETEDLFQASISEFFIARLLSPVSFNLVRPSQSGGISANEYTAVFDRDQNRVAFEFDGQTRNRAANPGFLFSGTEGRWGYALSYSPAYADGYRDNDRNNAHATYGSLQYQLSPETSLLLDTNLETFDDGDTEIGFDPFENDVDSNSTFDDYLVRLGGSHRFGPGSQLIGQVVGSRSSIRVDNATFDRALYVYLTAGDELLEALTLEGVVDERLRFRSNNIRGDLQHIYTSPYISNVLGGGLFNGDQDRDDEATVIDPVELSGAMFSSAAENTEGSRRLYDYLTVHVAPWLDLQGGVSYTHLHLSGAPLSVPFVEDVSAVESWDPKIGVVISPDESTVFRTAFFETTGSAALRELELIEPTIVSGFNQSFFNIIPGTTSRTLAFGLDRKFSTKTYVGAEVARSSIKRNFPLSVSQLFFDLDNGGELTTDIFVLDNDAHIDDHQWRAYVYQVVGTRVTATTDYVSALERDNLLDGETETQRLRLGLNYFDPSGWFGFARGTWRDQDIEGVRGITIGDETVAENFWLVDLGVGYRLPQRRGRLVLTVNNIFDTDFRYRSLGFEPDFLPGIGGSLSFAYNF
jgi:tetratricopeptide (TPR) repeat protein